MALSPEKLPNTPIMGDELRQLSLTLLTDEFQMRSVPQACADRLLHATDIAMRNDFLFAKTAAYPGIRLELRVKLHRCGEKCAFEITPIFKHMSNTFLDHTVFVRAPGGPPLSERSDDEQVECFTLSMKIENPNAVRVHYGLPIIRQVREEPKPGEMFGQFRTETLEYDPAECGPKPEPSVIDESGQYERMWGVKKEDSGVDQITSEMLKAQSDIDRIDAGAMDIIREVESTPQKHHGKKKGWNKTPNQQP